MSAWSVLRRWILRSAPRRSVILRAIAAGVATQAASTALLIGAPLLLCVAFRHRFASDPLVGVLAVGLAIIEILAFLRSPLRYLERTVAHEAGFEAVRHWRVWLTRSVGRWPFRRWSDAATGDLLDRALNDVDVLQDVWLRALLPWTATLLVTLAVDTQLGLLRGGVVVLITLLTLVIMAGRFAPLVAAARQGHHELSRASTQRLELSRVADELSLLGIDPTALPSSPGPPSTTWRRQGLALAALAVVASALVMIAADASSTFNYSQESLIRTLLLASVSTELFFATRHCLLVLSRVVVTADRLDEMAMPDPRVVTSAPFSDSIWVAEIGELAPVARVAIIGANGVGKSTWLRAVGQLDGSRPHQLLLGGVDAAELNEATLRQRVGYLSAQPSYLRGVVGDVLTLGRRLHADPIVLLGDLGIHANASDRWSERSRGEDQRAGLVRALVTAPSLLLLDEPTSALGDTETSAVLRLLETRASRVIVVTHDPRVIAWCDAVYELHDGELLRR